MRNDYLYSLVTLIKNIWMRNINGIHKFAMQLQVEHIERKKLHKDLTQRSMSSNWQQVNTGNQFGVYCMTT